jgi:hypothetical protein
LRTHNSRFRTTNNNSTYDDRTIEKLKSGFRNQINETTIQRSRTGSGFIGGDRDGAQNDEQRWGVWIGADGARVHGDPNRTVHKAVHQLWASYGLRLPGLFGFGANGAQHFGGAQGGAPALAVCQDRSDSEPTGLSSTDQRDQRRFGAQGGAQALTVCQDRSGWSGAQDSVQDETSRSISAGTERGNGARTSSTSHCCDN